MSHKPSCKEWRWTNTVAVLVVKGIKDLQANAEQMVHKKQDLCSPPMIQSD